MIKKIIIFIIFVIDAWTTMLWLKCAKFADFFHFSSLDMRLKLEEAVHNDKGFPSLYSRFFHNKVVFFAKEVFANYFHFWDIRFGVVFFSIIGYFGILCGLWYLLKSKTRYRWLVIIVYLILPFIEVFHSIEPYRLRLILLSVPYYAISLYGIWQFLKFHKDKGFWIVIVLVVFSIWYSYALPKEILLNCLIK